MAGRGSISPSKPWTRRTAVPNLSAGSPRMQEIWIIIGAMSWGDFFDIILVAVPFYLIFSLLREARSYTALWGIILMLVLSFLLYLVATVWNLQATALIYERFWIIVVLVFLIIFQGELKKGLTDIGRLRLFRALFSHETQLLSEVMTAVQDSAHRRVGALIAFERHNTLTPYLATGTMLDSQTSSDLIRSIFTPYSPLHDGAVIIRGDRLVAASCILPLTENPSLDRDLGTRHRAAIGLTEETDSLVIVVSEETGKISLAKDGKIEQDLSPDDLRRTLERELNLSTERDDGDAHG